MQSTDNVTHLPTAPAPSARPRTWTFISREDGSEVTVACMPGCESDHSGDIATPTHPSDVWCQAVTQDVTLPVNAGGKPEEYRVLGITMNLRPFSSIMAERLPYATVELVEDHYVEALDPDGLETVINTLAARLDQARAVHARLVEARAEWMQQRSNV